MTKGFYTHDRFMDAYVYVLKISYRGANYLKAKVEWWVRGQFIGIKQNVTILVRDLKYWRRR